MKQSPFQLRSSGILLHPTSLPGPQGSGDLGPAAHQFAQFLAAAGQRWWQMLPVGPPGAGNSPYDSVSSFAGGAHLLSLERFEVDGWLAPGANRAPGALSGPRAAFERGGRWREPLLRAAFERFDSRAVRRARLERFSERHDAWLPDFAMFGALQHAQGGAPWTQWETPLRARQPAALARARRRLATEIRYRVFLQYQFDRQWAALRAHCRRVGVSLLGDVPMFVAHDSADVWAHPDLFQVDRHGHPLAVAGVPPDAFSRTGQLWGNPLYRWDRLRATDYDWWIARLRRALGWFDALRLDHFIGLHRYWRVAAGARTAQRGRFVLVPGVDFLEHARAALGGLPFVAEDLGLLVDPVYALRDGFHLPGMRVLQFGFDADGGSYHQPHRYPPHSVAYTGTHDNDTLVGWLRGPGPHASRRQQRQAEARRQRVLCYAGSPGHEPHWDLIRLVLMSASNTAIFPLQDLLGLDCAARMNVPGTARGNWQWRLRPRQATRELARRMRELCQTYERA